MFAETKAVDKKILGILDHSRLALDTRIYKNDDYTETD